jgi:coenzyme F420-reducing hydrogenase alpha subunit
VSEGGTRTIKVDDLARVEGEGSLTIKLDGDRATEVRLGIFEPPRFFEALLRGRSYLEAPDITSRICGICPAAYLMSACHAMEDALGIRVEGALRDLRRLLYFGEWIESHVLHAFLLHAPDFLGYPDALTMAKDPVHGEWVKKSLRMKRAGNTIMERLGGREIHPVNVRVGGFYRVPEPGELRELLPELRWARAAAEEAATWTASLPVPPLERDYELVALSHPDEYPLCEGRLVSTAGLDIDVHDYDQHFVEEQVPHSNALHSRRVDGAGLGPAESVAGGGGNPLRVPGSDVFGRGACLSGPLARINLSFDRLAPAVQALARQVGVVPPIRNPFRALAVRLIEVVQAFEESIAIIERYVKPAAPFIAAEPRAGVGHGGTEAPRGFLYHRYEIDAAGTIVDARIIPPTSRNQRAMEEDFFSLAPQLAALPIEAATSRAEQAVRNHDPCISCATHFLTLKIERS